MYAGERGTRHAPTQRNIREMFSSCCWQMFARGEYLISARRCESEIYICALEKVHRIQQCTHTALVWRGRRLRPPADRRSSLPRPPAGKSSAAPVDRFRSHPLAHFAIPPRIGDWNRSKNDAVIVRYRPPSPGDKLSRDIEILGIPRNRDRERCTKVIVRQMDVKVT